MVALNLSVCEIDNALENLIARDLQGATLVTWKPSSIEYPEERHFVVMWRRPRSFDRIEYGTHKAMLWKDDPIGNSGLVSGHYFFDWDKAVKDYAKRSF